jgi:hypothetical protein
MQGNGVICMIRFSFRKDEQNECVHFRSLSSTKHLSSHSHTQMWQGLTCFFILLLYLLFTSIGTNIGITHAAPAILAKQAAFTVDNVTVNLQSNILPNTQFQSTKQGDFVQRALVTGTNPYTLVSVTAIPYGTRDDEQLPTAQAGIASTYRSLLRTAWQSQTQAPQNLAAISLFGTKVAGTLYHVQMPLDSLTPKPALIAEWVSEAGSRVWIVRVIQEYTSFSTNAFLQNLQGTILTSTTLGKVTTLQAHPTTTTKANVSPSATTGNLAYPSVWNGTLCDTYNHPTAYQLGTASYRGVPACGPRSAYDSDSYADLEVHYFPGAWGYWNLNVLSLS